MVNYVKPVTSERASPYSNVQRPCLTFNEYASNSDEYFVSNTRFYFHPGIHGLDHSLLLMNLYNFSFLNRPNGDQVVTIAVDSSASITWNESWNIEISSIKFTLYGNFTFVMRFERSQSVQLSNISIYGNWYSGCSSIISEESALEFKDSKFIGINGFVGAALMMYASNITFRGSTMFADNTAAYGGSIYLIYNSTLILNRTSLFLNNTISRKVMNRSWSILSCNYINSIMREIYTGTSAAIICDNSYLEIYYFTNNIGTLLGGAIMLNSCSLYIQGSVKHLVMVEPYCFKTRT